MKISNSELDKLAKVLNDNDLSYVKYEEGDCTVTLQKDSPNNTNVPTTNETNVEANVSSPQFEYSTIKCPLIGHFYISPSPGSEPFVKPGDRIEVGDTVGIVQAMKVSNEIKAEISGEVIEVLADDGQFVDFDCALLKVKE